MVRKQFAALFKILLDGIGRIGDFCLVSRQDWEGMWEAVTILITNLSAFWAGGRYKFSSVVIS